MVYNETFVASDLAPIGIDFTGVILEGFIGFTIVISMILISLWIFRKLGWTKL